LFFVYLNKQIREENFRFLGQAMGSYLSPIIKPDMQMIMMKKISQNAQDLCTRRWWCGLSETHWGTVI